MSEPCPQPIGSEAAAALIGPLTELVIRAGAAILAVNRGAMKVDGKSDGSPVTEADLAADRVIADGLARLAPEIPSLSEERVHQATPPYRGCFFLIDPLDGTKEFVAGRNEFTVNIALVSAGKPLLGFVGAPALGLLWRGLVGHGAERVSVTDGAITAVAPIRTRPCPPRGKAWTVAVSRSHGDNRTEGFIAGPTGRRAVRARLGGQVRPGGRRLGRYLSPPGADLGMGRRGRPCGRHGRRRQDHGFEAGRAGFWRGGGGFHRAGIHRLGRSTRQGPASRTIYCARPLARAGHCALASFTKRAGSAAKALRFSSRPNR